ncbi:NAC domain-containing protein 7 [Morella rubra]|uniref:NAC domain-containing protein 7 n=1 Tax=Morella rubra TaxID=262757 RepID=A0A6A1WSV0_9ROSI|nr:NAC domain-containing protein 7 [Morella rubra]
MSGLPLKLPRGFRFSPTDVELIDYLRSKISGDDEEVDFIPEIPFYKWEPWELPGKSSIPTMDPQWFFITQPEPKHRRGNRFNRKTKAGFWKPTGNDRKIMSGSRLIGMKKSLVFYEGRARECKKTSWVTHEYRTDPYQNSFLLCRVFDKRKGPNGAGPSVQSPTTSKSHLDETNSEIALGSVSPSSDATTPVENQSAQDTFPDLEMIEAWLQEPVDSNLSTSLPNTPAVSTPTTAKSSLEEAKSEIAVASVPPALGDGTYNYLPRRCPEKSVAGTTCNTILVIVKMLKEGMNLEKVSPAFPAVFPVTNDVNSSHGGVGLQNGMNENAPYSLEDIISLADLDGNFHNESGGQKDLASGFETPMNIVCSEDNGSCSGSNAEHGQVPWQYWANYPAAYSPECWELVFHNPCYVFPPIEPLGGSSNQILRSI